MPPPSHSLRTRRNRLWRTATPGLLALLAAFAAHAQVTFTGTYTQNFDTLAPSGTGNAWANNSTLPGWFLFNKTPSAIIAYDAGDGGGNTGKFYSFGTGTSADRALGGLASGGAYFGSPAIGSAAGWIAFAATNATGAPVHGVTVKFNGEQWRDGGAAAPNRQPMKLQYRFGGTFDAAAAWTDAPTPFSYESPVWANTATGAKVDGDRAGRVNNVGGDLDLSATPWAAGDTLWLRWIELNDAGSDHGLAIDDFSLKAIGSDTAAPTQQSSAPANGETGVALTPSITLTFDEFVTPGGGSFVLSQGGSAVATMGATDFTKAVFSANTVTLTPGIPLATGTTYTLATTGTAVMDQANNAWSSQPNLSFTTVAAPPPVTKISAIQGSGLASGMVGSTVTVSAVVTAYMPNLSGGGFFVQEEDADADADPATSEGIFVFYGGTNPGVDDTTVGKRVQFDAKVTEFKGQTELQTISNFVVVGPAALPAPVQIRLPVSSIDDLERYEGMRVEVASATAGGKLVVSDNFNLGRYGQATVAPDDLQVQFTERNAPGKAGFDAYNALLKRSQIVLDDANGRQNPTAGLVGRGGLPLSASNPLRAGDYTDKLVGILDQFVWQSSSDSTSSSNAQPQPAAHETSYRIQPVAGSAPHFTAKPRPTAADIPAAIRSAPIKVASANVLNYFTTFDSVTTTNETNPADDFLTPTGEQHDSRGANNQAEFLRQQSKVVANLLGLDADVYGLMEIQNNGFATPTGNAGGLATPYLGKSGIQSLVDALNDGTAPNTFAYVQQPSTGTDAIMTAIVYKPAKLTPVGGAATPNPATYDAFNGALYGNRIPIAQTFQSKANGGKFTLVVNHLKSKGSGDATKGLDTGDGQGNSYLARERAAAQLLAWLGTQPTGDADADLLLVGDFNAYSEEKAVKDLIAGGYKKVSSGYSYSFDGLWGSLDHIFASSALDASGQITAVYKWAINAEEPGVLDYNTDFKSVAQQSDFYAADPYRSSDHNPIILGLNLLGGGSGNQPPSIAGVPAVAQTVAVGQAADLDNVTVADPEDAALTLTISATNGRVLGLTDADAAAPGIQLKGKAAQINAQFAGAVFMADGAGAASVALSLSDGVNMPVSANYPLQASASVVLPANRFSITPAGQATVGGTVSGGGCTSTAAQLVTPASVNADTRQLPPGATLPYGMLKLDIAGCNHSGLATVTLSFPSLPAGAQYWKWGPTPDNHAPHWYQVPTRINGNTVAFALRDGGLGDSDLAADQAIADPGAVVMFGASGVASVPTLGEWALAVLSLLLGLAAMGHQAGWRGRQRAP